jgi:Phosphotransferase enzyme family
LEIVESEARMLDHASRILRVRTPMLRGVNLEGGVRTMFTDFIPGVTVHSVWKKLSRSDQKLIIQDLRAEIVKMRQSTRPRIGRVGWDGNIATDDPYRDPYFPDTHDNTMSFFRSESEFDNHKIKQIRNKCGEPAAKELESRIKPLRGQYSEKFVLTHADLHQDNILVRQVRDASGKSTWRLSGIVDWARSGYYPEYMEYATAMNDGPTHPYWRKVMKEVLKGLECSKQRLKVEGAATYWAL